MRGVCNARHSGLPVALALALWLGGASLGMAADEGSASACVAPIAYLPLDGDAVGRGSDGVAALGTYERISPDGRFILRSYSGGRLGQVSLMELPASGAGPIRVYQTPFRNEAFPVQQSWRYLVDVNGEHYRTAEVLRQQKRTRPLFKGGMTGFYAAASEMIPPSDVGPGAPIHIRSLSWPQGGSDDSQGVGPLQVETLAVEDDGTRARIVQRTGPQFICGAHSAVDGGVYALPMISVDGTELSAIPQAPRAGSPTMRVYSLSADPMASTHPCERRADLGYAPGKAVFGFPSARGQPGHLVFSDIGHVYWFDRTLSRSFRLDHGQWGVLASAFPGLTADGRVIYGASWRTCEAPDCPRQAGYVVVDPYQSHSYRAHWQQQGVAPPRTCITRQQVAAERQRLAQRLGIAP